MKDFCGPRQIYVDNFGPSSFLICAGLLYPFSSTKKMSHVTATVKNALRWQQFCDNYRKTYLQIVKAGHFFANKHYCHGL